MKKLLLLLAVVSIAACEMPTGSDGSGSGTTGTDSYSLSITVNGQGSVTNSAGTTTFAPGETVTLTAVPEQDHFFSGWTGDESSNETQITVTMDSDKDITATFTEAIRDVRFSYSASSSSADGSFIINYGLRNFGNVSVQFTSGAYVIYGSAGSALTDITLTQDTYPVGTTLQPGEEVFAVLGGYSTSYIPYSFLLEISYTDQLGDSFSFYPNYPFVVQ